MTTHAADVPAPGRDTDRRAAARRPQPASPRGPQPVSTSTCRALLENEDAVWGRPDYTWVVPR
ncbi:MULTISPECIES: hypothetical protein [unclassified Nocardiopsis]|uniref:hypothetical protein n=1 Tax=unclassified Nocardiopsis TaxID=2649073 RepID=UPI00135BEBB5|nr:MULTISPECIES: hypothetical protein [unclassified Nocardiopsis]